MVRQLAPSNAKWYVDCNGYGMTSQKRSELMVVLRRFSANDPRFVNVSLSWTGCGDYGANLISDVLKVNTALRSLDLYHNDIGPSGGIELSSALKKNTSLLSLNLDWNNIGDDGAEHFLHTLTHYNTNLTSLSLKNNHVMPSIMESINAILSRNSTLKIEAEWKDVNQQLVPLRYLKSDYESKRNFFENLPECNEGPILEQREFYTQKIAGVQSEIAALEAKENKMLEDGTWFRRNLVKLRKAVDLRMTVKKAIERFKIKERREPTIAEQREVLGQKLLEMQRLFSEADAVKWKPEYRKKKEEEYKELQIEQIRLRSLERSQNSAKLLEKVEEAARSKNESGVRSTRPEAVENINAFAPKGGLKFHDDLMPLTYKYMKFDRRLREAGVSILKDEITYRACSDSGDMGRRFQEAYLDTGDRTVLGVRLRDRNPKTIYYKRNKYGADLVY